jgi:hypothetical protein
MRRVVGEASLDLRSSDGLALPGARTAQRLAHRRHLPDIVGSDQADDLAVANDHQGSPIGRLQALEQDIVRGGCSYESKSRTDDAVLRLSEGARSRELRTRRNARKRVAK